MPSRFLNNISINDEYSFPATDGSADQIIQTDGSGNLTFVDPSVLSVGESEQVHIACKNTSGVAISKGDPVYITGTVGTSFIIQIAAADASNSAKMPAVGLAETDLGLNAEGFVIVSGVLKNLTTDPLSTSDGTPSSNDTVYVKAGGGLTRTKPTGSGNLIQNVGKVGRVSSANSGSLAVSTIMRTNDVPNLTTGKIWVGSPTYTTESTVVHLDETNGRMGIGTASPNDLLEIKSTTVPGIRLNSTDTSFPTFGSITAYNNTTYRGGLSWANNPAQAGAKITYIGFPSGSQKTGTFEVGADFVDTTINNGSMVTRLNTTGLGIGTTSPSEKLHVDGSIRVGDTNDVVYADKFFTVSNANLHIGANNGYDTVFFNGPADERMRITSTGNVGIGTTSPNAALDVNGAGNFSGGTVVSGIDSTITGVAIPKGMYLKSNDGNYLRNIIGHTSSGNIEVGQAGTSLVGDILLRPGAAGNIRFFGSGSEDMRINSAGNVGIGTTSPSATLDVTGSGLGAKIHSAQTTGLQVSGGGNSQDIARFQNVSGSTKVTINHAGNVGIGITSPSYKLDISGDLRVDNGNIGSTSGDELTHARIQGARHFLDFKEIRTANDTDWRNTTFKLQAGVDATKHQSIDFVSDNNYQEHIDILTGNQVFNTRFTYDGKVGIGTTSPSTTLQVLGTSSSMPSLGAPPTAAHFGGSTYGTLFSTLTSGRGVIQQGRVDGTQLSFDLLLQPVGGNVAIGKTSAGVKLDVAGDVRVDGLDNFLYTTNTNDIYTFGSSTQTMANAPNGYLWHDLLAFNYVYTTTQEVTSDGTNWSSTTLQKDLFAQKEGQAITVISSTQTGVRWTFNNTAWGSAILLNVAFTYVASDINKNILVESSSNGTSWTTRFTNTATAGTGTKTCKLTSYGGDAYVRVTITKAVSSSNLVRMSQLRLMTLRAGDQGYGREYHLPITWDGDRNIGIKLASPTTSISEALEVNGSVKATADTDAYKGYIKSIITTGYSMKSASTAYQYIPYNSYTLTTLQAYYNRTVAAYNGRVKKIIVKRIDGASADATGMKFKKEINGTVIATEYTATVLYGSGNFQATYNFANSDFTFNAGDSIGVLMQSSGGTGMIGAGAIQIVLEYNIT